MKEYKPLRLYKQKMGGFRLIILTGCVILLHNYSTQENTVT